MKIRKRQDGKLACIVEDMPGGAPKAIVRQRIGTKSPVHVYPLAATSLESMTGDLLLASRADAELLPGVAKVESGCLTGRDRKTIDAIYNEYNESARTGSHFDLWRRWKWLKLAAEDYEAAQVYLPFP